MMRVLNNVITKLHMYIYLDYTSLTWMKTLYKVLELTKQIEGDDSFNHFSLFQLSYYFVWFRIM